MWPSEAQVLEQDVHEAAKAGDLERLKELLAANGNAPASTEWADEAGFTALVRRSSPPPPVPSWLLPRLGTAPPPASHNQRRTLPFPQHWAAHGRHPDCVRLLLAAGASVDARTQGGWTPLLLAAFNGHCDCVQALLSAGAEPDARAPVRPRAQACRSALPKLVSRAPRPAPHSLTPPAAPLITSPRAPSSRGSTAPP